MYSKEDIERRLQSVFQSLNLRTGPFMIMEAPNELGYNDFNITTPYGVVLESSVSDGAQIWCFKHIDSEDWYGDYESFKEVVAEATAEIITQYIVKPVLESCDIADSLIDEFSNETEDEY